MTDTNSLRPALVAAAQQLGLSLSDSQIEQLLAYQGLIQKWNKVYNLTAVRDPQAMLTQHLVDSLSLLPALLRHAEGRPLRLMDVGSGGGLPGVVVAICAPQIDVTCVDAVAKKASFIKQVAAELGLKNLHGEHSRVEALEVPPFDLITSRAFASLLDFTSLTRQHLKPRAESGAKSGAIWLAMKGQHPAEELAALPPDLDVFHVEQLQVPGLDAQRCLIWIKPRA
ncbi:MAG: 16S rRNA (guanine(527)-N(7))-methyltransferase RsmG [Roseateles asaccharophilus]|uniref:Ribosomal RNA small subunit methyltransferase G n=1 Tax=Roseateles asaccharophilus TaxID=582607 RepID=A0A4R6ND46_9BURK|nr:16S rRNA (guanine(527)-N(7))-methyltransferase RsmG [Roseateles asaccharophilus]MDN3543366.1 16S rRNA (guanine(527)-N(7))-methyltransferase RsmG [Roseateles asaccharophilus]TDP12935.1 16S rRNA m(7)G-527 methyltransferase [Roseateles asaccharophilus]